MHVQFFLAVFVFPYQCGDFLYSFLVTHDQSVDVVFLFKFYFCTYMIVPAKTCKLFNTKAGHLHFSLKKWFGGDLLYSHVLLKCHATFQGGLRGHGHVTDRKEALNQMCDRSEGMCSTGSRCETCH
jgi:hypothetical protein